MKKKILNCNFNETPLWKNDWWDTRDIVSDTQVGVIEICCDGSWGFNFTIDNEFYKIFAMYVGGEPTNILSYQGGENE